MKRAPDDDVGIAIAPSDRLSHAIRWLPGALRSGGARRVRWGVIDQGFSSLTSFATTAVVAHEVAPAEFGAFSVALVVYICVLWLARSLVGEPFGVRMAAAPPATLTAAARQATGAALVIGLTGAAAMWAVGALLGSTSGGVLVAMGIFMPSLLTQDAYRYVLITSGRARAAAVNDGVWLGVQAVLVAGLLINGHPGATGLVMTFGSGATVGALLGARQSGTLPSPRCWLVWLRAHRDLGIPFVTELLVINAVPQMSMLGVAALGGVVAVGELRAAMFLCSPPTVLFSGLVLVAIPEAVRMRQRSVRDLRRLVVGLTLLMMVVTALWAGGLALMPADVGTALLESNWARGRRLLLPTAIFVGATAWMLSGLVGLRSLEATRSSLRARVWGGPVILVSTVIGAHVWGSEGAGFGLAGSAAFSAALTWAAFRRAVASEAVRDGLMTVRDRGTVRAPGDYSVGSGDGANGARPEQGEGDGRAGPRNATEPPLPPA